ncbi:MAG: AbrB/MazE/SpoVT family DNA-binding domain-containing protein [Pseudomonadota bacterium]
MNREIIPITERGTITLPSSFRKTLGLSGKQQLIGEINALGEIVLRPAVFFPLEIYSEERIAEFSEQDNALEVFLNKKI